MLPDDWRTETLTQNAVHHILCALVIGLASHWTEWRMKERPPLACTSLSDWLPNLDHPLSAVTVPDVLELATANSASAPSSKSASMIGRSGGNAPAMSV